jgi:hypothetical protein
MLIHSQKKKKVGGSTNSSFLALIPKGTNLASFVIFQPISSCHFSYKILTKIMANKLKWILPKIISENQGGLMQKRQIVENIILIRGNSFQQSQ